MAQTKSRTDQQHDADRFDCDLYRLITRAERAKGGDWANVAGLLRAARRPVRAMMHPDDVAQTE